MLFYAGDILAVYGVLLFVGVWPFGGRTGPCWWSR
jgi:hypothetical protein